MKALLSLAAILAAVAVASCGKILQTDAAITSAYDNQRAAPVVLLDHHQPWDQRVIIQPRHDEWRAQPWRSAPWGVRPWGSAPWRNQPWGDQPWGNQPWGSAPWRNQPWGDQPWGNQPWGSAPWRNQPWGDQPWRAQPWRAAPWRAIWGAPWRRGLGLTGLGLDDQSRLLLASPGLGGLRVY